MTTLKLLCAGAAKGVVDRLKDAFAAETGREIDAFFSAVGAIKERFLSEEPCDVLVLSKVLVDELAGSGRLVAATAAPIGTVRTGVAVRNDEQTPAIDTPEALAASFKAASGGIFVPDTVRSTAGIHVLGVMRKLGIDEAVKPQIREFPNGETAMRHLSESTAPGAIGCTQVTEINNTPGIRLVGHLPKEHELSTVYAVAVAARAQDAEGAALLVEWLTGPRSQDLRARCGFEI